LLNFGKVSSLEKQAQAHAEKKHGAGIVVTQNLHEETGNAASNLCWQSAQDHVVFCSKIVDVHRIKVHDART